ncbi:BLUF domain-containing protein [Erythrobacter sp. Alg231-14]|uniref:BLUF domain-containing protein n=1 Tax=Erythrobacter sp. Alg231-14 TaxID=1922225 RepID=UPI00307C57E0
MLSQYLYISTAPSLTRDDVAAILDSSARNNPARGITGLLLYNGRNFLQLLEGEGAELDALMKRIGQDRRHTGVSLLNKTAVSERACPQWAMKRVIIADSVSDRRKQLDADLPNDLEPTVRQMVLNFAVLN